MEGVVYSSKAQFALVVALENMFAEACLIEPEEVDYAAVCEIVQMIGALVQSVLDSGALELAGSDSEYELTANIGNGKVAWQLTGKGRREVVSAPPSYIRV